MGLMTDGLHETIEIMATRMVQAAKGQIEPEFLGRYVYTYHREHAKGLPKEMRRELSESEIVHLRSLPVE